MAVPPPKSTVLPRYLRSYVWFSHGRPILFDPCKQLSRPCLGLGSFIAAKKVTLPGLRSSLLREISERASEDPLSLSHACSDCTAVSSNVAQGTSIEGLVAARVNVQLSVFSWSRWARRPPRLYERRGTSSERISNTSAVLSSKVVLHCRVRPLTLPRSSNQCTSFNLHQRHQCPWFAGWPGPWVCSTSIGKIVRRDCASPSTGFRIRYT